MGSLSVWYSMKESLWPREVVVPMPEVRPVIGKGGLISLRTIYKILIFGPKSGQFSTLKANTMLAI